MTYRMKMTTMLIVGVALLAVAAVQVDHGDIFLGVALAFAGIAALGFVIKEM